MAFCRKLRDFPKVHQQNLGYVKLTVVSRTRFANYVIPQNLLPCGLQNAKNGPVGRGDERRRVKRKRGYIIRAVFAQGVFPYSASRALFHSSSSSRFDVKILGSYFNLPLLSLGPTIRIELESTQSVYAPCTRVCIIRFAIFFANDSARSIPRTRIRRFCFLYREDFTYCFSVCALLYKYFPIGALRARWCRLYPE